MQNIKGKKRWIRVRRTGQSSRNEAQPGSVLGCRGRGARSEFVSEEVEGERDVCSWLLQPAAVRTRHTAARAATNRRPIKKRGSMIAISRRCGARQPLLFLQELRQC